MNALEVSGLGIDFVTDEGTLLPAVRDVSFSLPRGEVTCLVGESGCGKSLTARACLRILPKNTRTHGRIILGDTDITACSEKDMQRIRGNRMSMIFQEPMTALNPVLTAGSQVAEALRLHMGMDRAQARSRTIELFSRVGIPSPEQRFSAYPHELSGGMRQRVMIAMALACSPSVLLADEPTTALDPTTQGQILGILQDEGARRGMAVLLITHDLGVVAQTASQVGVMYAGRLVEKGLACEVLMHPAHPYTQGLLAAAPSRQALSLDRLPTVPGSVPPLGSIPSGCPFRTRCPRASAVCAEAFPEESGDSGHRFCCVQPQA